MRVTGGIPNLPVADIDAARGFYADYLGLSVEEMNLGWVARFASPDGRASVQLVTRDATSPVDSVMSGTTWTRLTRKRSAAATRSFIHSPRNRGASAGSWCATQTGT
jgi:catechol 2,3-dioxygenase-like lactoylglutathione lyase family enzyme